MQGIIRPLIVGACALLFAHEVAHAQVVVCPGEPVIFQVAEDYYGTKSWEYSPDGITWNTVEVTENEPLSLQPEQLGWYRVRFHDVDCDTSYLSNAVRFAVPTIDLGATLSLSIGGRVTDETGESVRGATVRAGCGAGISTTTDGFGVFLLEGITAYEQLATVSVEKEGYLNGSRSFVPAASASGTVSYVNITLLAKNFAGTVNGATGGTVALEDVTITFPPNAFVRDGQPYTGAVHVALNHIDPTSDSLHLQMPGMLMGVMDDQPQMLLSYGMVGAELSDDAGRALQLAPGSPATVRFPVMPDQQAYAPQVIPLWWYDEVLGYWVHEGEAQRVGNEYVGQLAHFSWWNCDTPGNFVRLEGTVLDQSNGARFINARVVLQSPSMGSGTNYTNGMGEFTGLVPNGESMTLQIWLPCEVNGTYELFHEEAIGPYQDDSVIVVVVDGANVSLLWGNVLDCASTPVEQGYVWADGQVVFCSEGAYQLTTCAIEISLRGVDLLANNASRILTVELNADTTQAEDLTTCTPLYGSVTDIDGNSYVTVLIGSQEWMAENLKTTRYRDGSAIPNVTNTIEWDQLTSEAWCYYLNDAANDAVHGNLYNGYAAANPNICPQRWHVPTETEWQQLELALGMPLPDLTSTSGSRGEAQNVGGKMKALTLWTSNIGSTNESGFSGLPGGLRSNNGTFTQLNLYGHWWSASETTPGIARNRTLSYNSAGVTRSASYKEFGFCVRCIRD